MPENIPAIVANDSFIEVNTLLGLAFLFAVLAFVLNLVNFLYVIYLKKKLDTEKIVKEYLEEDNEGDAIDWIVYERRMLK